MVEHKFLLLWMLIVMFFSYCIFSMKIFFFIDSVSDDSRRKNVDGLRFFLSALVAFHHYVLCYYYFEGKGWALENLSDYAFNMRAGSVAVMIFFILSGFLFYGLKTDKWDVFYFKRFLRIAPVFFFSSLICIAVAAFIRRHELDYTEFRYSFLLWFDAGITGEKSSLLGMPDSMFINASVTWTLFWEWGLYFSLPLVLLLRDKAKPLTFSLICLFLSVYVFRVMKPEYSIFLACFSCGFLARAWVFDQRYSKLKCDIGVLSCVGILFLFYESPYSIYALPVLALLFIFIVSGGDVFGLLSCRAMVRLGEISYSIYLLHGIFWFCMNYFIKHFGGGISTTAYMIISAATFIAMLLFSSLTYQFIEKPFMKIAMRLGKKS